MEARSNSGAEIFSSICPMQIDYFDNLKANGAVCLCASVSPGIVGLRVAMPPQATSQQGKTASQRVIRARHKKIREAQILLFSSSFPFFSLFLKGPSQPVCFARQCSYGGHFRVTRKWWLEVKNYFLQDSDLVLATKSS